MSGDGARPDAAAAEEALRLIHLGLIDGLQLLELVCDLMGTDALPQDQLKDGVLVSRLALGGVIPHLRTLILFVSSHDAEGLPSTDPRTLNS